ncbi:unnamed protein product [Ophioblennius macclurei]
MWRCWTAVVLACVSMATPVLCQSGDGDWGSGFDVVSSSSAGAGANGSMRAFGDEPAWANNNNNHDHWRTPEVLLSSPPSSPDRCSVFFSTSGAGARRLKAQREELAYLQAIQKGNKAVMESLEQFVGAAETGERRYEDVIRENVAGIQEDHKGCQEVLEKAEDDLEKQLEGGGAEANAGMQKIREESRAFEVMLRAAADTAGRLEVSWRALQAAFAKQLDDIVKLQH